jgi:hypothetical protein
LIGGLSIMHGQFISHRQSSALAPQHETPPSSRVSSKVRYRLAALLVMASPLLAWPLVALFVIGGCAGSPGVVIKCSPILGIDVQAVATHLTWYSTSGFAFSVPLALALLVSCRFLSPRRGPSDHPAPIAPVQRDAQASEPGTDDPEGIQTVQEVTSAAGKRDDAQGLMDGSISEVILVNNEGVRLAYAGELETAVAKLTQAAERLPGNMQIASNAALVLALSVSKGRVDGNRLADCLKYRQRVVERDPNHSKLAQIDSLLKQAGADSIVRFRANSTTGLNGASKPFRIRARIDSRIASAGNHHGCDNQPGREESRFRLTNRTGAR